MFLFIFSDCWDNEKYIFLCFLGAFKAVISYSLSFLVEKHRCIEQGGKGGNTGLLKKAALCKVVWEKQIILALFYAGLHIVSTCAVFCPTFLYALTVC